MGFQGGGGWMWFSTHWDILASKMVVVFHASLETKLADNQGKDIVDTLMDKFELMENGTIPSFSGSSMGLYPASTMQLSVR